MENLQIPALTANYKPFRLIVDDQDGPWQVSCEDIDNNTYDKERLSRIVLALDVGISPYTMLVCVDGTLILPVTYEIKKDRNKALEIFNTFLINLLFGGEFVEAILPDDVRNALMTNTGKIGVISGSGGEISNFHIRARFGSLGIPEKLQLLNPKIIKKIDFLKAYNQGKYTSAKFENFSFEQFIYGIRFFVHDHNMESIIHFWTTLESLIDYALECKIELVNGKDGYNKIKKWNISTKIEFLFQKNKIPESIYRKLENTRDKRNKLIHRGEKLTQEEALLFLEVLLSFMSLIVSDFNKLDEFSYILEMVSKAKKGYSKESGFHKSCKPTHWVAVDNSESLSFSLIINGQ